MKIKLLEKLLITGVLLASLIIAFSGCSSDDYDYIEYDSAEETYFSAPRITFEYPDHYAFELEMFKNIEFDRVIPVFDDEDSTPLYTEELAIYSTDGDIAEAELTGEEDFSLIIITYCNEKSTSLWRQQNKDIRDMVLTLGIVDRNYEEDFVEKPTSVGNIPARLLFVQIEEEQSEYVETRAVAYFEAEDCYWMISWMLWHDLAEEPPPYFYHLLDTFEILE